VQGLGAERFMALADVEDARAAQAGEYGDLVVRVAGFAQSDDLHAALVPRFAAQRSHVGCLHESELRAVQKISSAQGPDQ
jgi:hypothetical protein